MFLILLLKILFYFLVISHTIRWVSYHIHHRNKKERVFHGNTRMPFDVEFALMYGINAKLKNRFKFKDLSYRKTLLQWKLLLNEIYPDDDLYFKRQLNSNLATPKSPKGDFRSACFSEVRVLPVESEFLFLSSENRKYFPVEERSTPKSPLGDLGVTTRKNNSTRIKKAGALFTAKPCAKNKSFVASFLFNTKILSLKNLKNPQKPMPFAKQIMACYSQNLWFDFLFIFLFLK